MKTILVKHYLEPYEISRLKALGKAMDERIPPHPKPYTFRQLLQIYGTAGCADLWLDYVTQKPEGVTSFYSPKGITE